MIHSQLSGFVLAGGKSTRMGQDKASLSPCNGRTLLEHALAALRGVCRDVAILGKYELYGDAGAGLRRHFSRMRAARRHPCRALYIRKHSST